LKQLDLNIEFRLENMLYAITFISLVYKLIKKKRGANIYN